MTLPRKHIPVKGTCLLSSPSLCLLDFIHHTKIVHKDKMKEQNVLTMLFPDRIPLGPKSYQTQDKTHTHTHSH